MEMVIAKSDMAIAEQYAGTGGAALRCPMPCSPRIRDGWQQTRDGLLCWRSPANRGFWRNSPALDASVRLRLPYIEPLNLLQIELLKRHRAGEADARIGEGILLSINAIATGLRNSG